MIPVNENLCYILKDEAAIEDFEDGSLMFLCLQKKIIEINHSARRVLSLMNGKRTLRQIIKKIACDFKIHEKEAREDIQRLVVNLGDKGAIRPEVKLILKRRNKMGKSLGLLANPDISLREEKDGAILLNADTNALQIINPIGLVIWKFIKVHPRTRIDIVSHLKEVCEGVPADQVEGDVEKFINELQGKGFIGEVLYEKQPR